MSETTCQILSLVSILIGIYTCKYEIRKVKHGLLVLGFLWFARTVTVLTTLLISFLLGPKLTFF